MLMTQGPVEVSVDSHWSRIERRSAVVVGSRLRVLREGPAESSRSSTAYGGKFGSPKAVLSAQPKLGALSMPKASMSVENDSRFARGSSRRTRIASVCGLGTEYVGIQTVSEHPTEPPLGMTSSTCR